MKRIPALSLKNSPLRNDSKLARQRGASLLEGIAYLGIAALVVLGAVSLLTGAFSSAKSNQANEEVIALRTAIRKLYIGQVYPADIMPGLVAANAVPGTLIKAADGTVTNSWGGAVTASADSSSNGFNLVYQAVPQDVCVNMLSGANGWVSIAGTTTITTFPVTTSAATGTCTVTTNAGNTLTFKGV
ncbi:pilus assembly protein [Herbaspirillum hiltneri N3]|uniref:Pilus assembly protein n=1 Tax=Herbaspirillum hiltneri N3 TaxID=1262470 RepID=A0ABN4HWB7_9BURK|nr:type 4 pilus major pilin [Herbaspirillum hiltneri]AKZ62899.1 pilus assembly protein [Herbaspirillum hiltneri N3]